MKCQKMVKTATIFQQIFNKIRVVWLPAKHKDVLIYFIIIIQNKEKQHILTHSHFINSQLT